MPIKFHTPTTKCSGITQSNIILGLQTNIARAGKINIPLYIYIYIYICMYIYIRAHKIFRSKEKYRQTINMLCRKTKEG